MILAVSVYFRIIWRIFLLLALYQAARIFFWVTNSEQFPISPTLLSAFEQGVRFDLSSILILNAIYILAVLGGCEKFLPRLLRWMFVITNGIFLLFNFGDAVYYQFSGNRLTLASFSIVQDIENQVTQIAAYYWYVSLIGLLPFVLLYLLHGKETLFQTSSRIPWPKRVGLHLLFLVAIVIAGRGGLQAKPLNLGHAYLNNDSRYSILTLNSTFTILKSYGLETLKKVNDIANWDELRQALPSDPLHKAQYSNSPNIVFIILESFGREYMGYEQPWQGYTPFLDELASRSVFFKVAFANGRRSIDALPSILAGIPSLMTAPLITSTYQTRDIVGLPEILKQNGYTTSFFHGGHDGTMFFDVLASRLGIETYYGSSSYPDQSDDDGQWGIFDEPFLHFTAKTLDQTKEPFFATLFTLSSHHPYKIPEQYRAELPAGPLSIHQSIRYADFALKNFFEYAKQQPWYSHTLFVLTADHTSKSETPQFSHNIGKYRVPIMLFHPEQNPRIENSDTLAQHVDIMPTILDLLGIRGTEHARFGRSLVEAKESSPIVLFQHPHYWSIGSDIVLQATEELHETDYYLWRQDPELETPVDAPKAVKDQLYQQLILTRQYYHNGLLDNRINW